MNKYWHAAILILVINGLNAQPQITPRKFQTELLTAIGSSWWIYTLGSGDGIDRTDNEAKVSLEVNFLYKPGRFGIGIGVGHSLLLENEMEAFEDTRAQRRKYLIADDRVSFWQYSMLMEYSLFQSHRLSVSPQLRIGTFSIDSTHPQRSNFNGKSLLELGAVNEIRIWHKLRVVLKPFYQVLGISVKQELEPGEKHRIFSLGLAGGVRYVL